MNTSTPILTAVCSLALAGSTLTGAASAGGFRNARSSRHDSGSSMRASTSYANLSQGANEGIAQQRNVRANPIYATGDQFNFHTNLGRFQNVRSSRNDFNPKNPFWKRYANWSDGPAKYMGGSPPSRAPEGTPENPFRHSDRRRRHEHHHHGKHHPDKNPIVNTIHPIVNNNPTSTGGSSLNGAVHHLPISAIQAKPNTTLTPGLYSNGFVWTGDHWERPRAGGGPYHPYPIPGGPTIPVRDHSHDPARTTGGAVNLNPPADVQGVGGSPIDSAIRGAVSGIGSVIDYFNPVKPDPLYQPPHFTDHRHP